jgi:hypothetical protein
MILCAQSALSSKRRDAYWRSANIATIAMTGASSAADLVCQLINIDHVSSRDGANPMSRELTMPVSIFGAEKGVV